MNRQSIKIITTMLLIFFMFEQGLGMAYADTFKYSRQIRANIIDKFKDEQYGKVFEGENVLLSENLNFFDTQKRISIYESIRNNNLEQQAKLIDEKLKVTKRIDSLAEMVAQLDEEIQKSNKQIVSFNSQITIAYGEIKQLEGEISEIQKEIVRNNSVLIEYIAHIYKKQNLVFEDEQIDSLKALFLNGGSLGDVLSELHFSGVMEITGQMLLEQHRTLLRQQYIKKMSLSKYKKELTEARKAELEARKNQVEQKDFREKILAFSKTQESSFSDFISKKEEINQRIKKSIFQNKIKIQKQKVDLLKQFNCEYINMDALNAMADDEVYFQRQTGTGTTTATGTVTGSGVATGSGVETATGAVAVDQGENDCVVLNRILAAEAQLRPLPSDTENVLAWPVEPTNGLSAYFKDPEYERIVGSSHDAIDIVTPQGTEIKAPADGYITFMRKPDDENYAYVVLKHTDGMITVYGHVSEILFNLYDYIPAGTVFAKSGGTLGTNGAGYMTTGPHLHMEVFKNKENVDPLQYLSLTALGPDKLPQEQKYAYKFLQDYKEVNGVDFEGELADKVRVFQLKGDTEEERQRYLLDTYAVGEFRNWDLWVEEAIEGNIDPSFLMCIGLSETGLGKNLKTGYNVGNVGNTDSGGTRDFDNARSGVYRMANTLNNKFLSKYDRMDKLSRYGNKDGSIYASSPINWHRNMTRCISALKGEYIPDDFQFRTK